MLVVNACTTALIAVAVTSHPGLATGTQTAVTALLAGCPNHNTQHYVLGLLPNKSNCPGGNARLTN